MKLTQTLLGYLNRVFSRDPQKFLALQFEYAGDGMSWAVDDGVLTVAVTGGVGAGFTIALDDYTLRTLSGHIAGLAGFTVTALAATDLAGMSAAVLLDGAGSQSTAGGSSLFAYSNPLFSYMESVAVELEDAEDAIVEALKQVSIRDVAGNANASGYWLDEIGSYYDVPRLSGEMDAVYGPRIIAEVLRPRANNVALEAAIKTYTGQQTTVTDVALPAFTDPLYDSAHTHNGSVNYSSTGTFAYGLFDVVAGYDIIGGGDISEFLATVQSVIGRLRDAGTHMRSLLLGPSALSDSFVAPSDSFGNLAVGLPLSDSLTGPADSGYNLAATLAALSDSFTPPADTSDGLITVYDYTYDSIRRYDSAIRYCGGYTGTGDLSGASETLNLSANPGIDPGIGFALGLL